VPQEYAVSNAPRVSLNPLSDEHQAMRGRGEGGHAHELTGSITQASQKSLLGLALGRVGRGELEFSVLWKERSEAFCSVFARDRERANGSLGLIYSAKQLSQRAKQQYHMPQRAVAQILSGPLNSLSNGSHQLNEQVAKICNPAVHGHARMPLSILNGTSCTTKQLSTSLY